ncbi:MAG: DUF1080 domain-containing protein, partial [Isosphaeraceae bacterium]
MFRRLGTMLCLIVFLQAGSAVAADTPSALEESPDGWIDLLANTGTELRGWIRGTIPPGGKLKGAGKGQWTYDPKTQILTSAGDLGHEWLRWDEEVGDAIFH